MNWKPILIGFAIGAVAGFIMGGKATSGANPGITGAPNAPFQSQISR